MFAASAGAGRQPSTTGQIYFYGDILNPINSPFIKNPLVVSPSALFLTQDGTVALEDLHWSGWGSSVARATGVSSASSCNPSCATGRRTNSPAQFTLSSPGRVLGHEVYRCFQLTVPSYPKSDEHKCLSLVGKLYGYASVPAPSPVTARAVCSTATARILIDQHGLNGFLLPPAQVLCGPFTGPGSEAMAVTMAAATCWSVQAWAVFSFSGGTWKLVFVQGAFIVPPLVAVGADIKVTTPVFRSTDQARCLPTGGTRARLWSWDGTTLTPGPWHQVTPGLTTVTPIAAGFYSVPGWACDMIPQEVFCENPGRGYTARLLPSGETKICKAGPAVCETGNPGLRTPTLRYGERVTSGPFQCSFAKSGLTCVVVKTGRGFRISNDITVIPVGT